MSPGCTASFGQASSGLRVLPLDRRFAGPLIRLITQRLHRHRTRFYVLFACYAAGRPQGGQSALPRPSAFLLPLPDRPASGARPAPAARRRFRPDAREETYGHNVSI